MTFAIIGSGKMGSGFARLLASKGFDIAIGNINPEKPWLWLRKSALAALRAH
jgi:predicted dinucleotide-binding enzyme